MSDTLSFLKTIRSFSHPIYHFLPHLSSPFLYHFSTSFLTFFSTLPHFFPNRPLDPIRSAKNANLSASYVVNNASTLGSLGNIRRVSLSLISTSSKSSEKDNKNSKKESEKSFPSLPVVGSENGSDKELLFRPVISNNNVSETFDALVMLTATHPIPTIFIFEFYLFYSIALHPSVSVLYFLFHFSLSLHYKMNNVSGNLSKNIDYEWQPDRTKNIFRRTKTRIRKCSEYTYVFSFFRLSNISILLHLSLESSHSRSLPLLCYSVLFCSMDSTLLYSTLLYSSSLIPADQTLLFLNPFFLIRLTSVVFSCPLVDISAGTSSAFSFKGTIPRYPNSLYSTCSSSMLFIEIFTQLRICYIAPTTHISTSFFFYSLF